MSWLYKFMAGSLHAIFDPVFFTKADFSSICQGDEQKYKVGGCDDVGSLKKAPGRHECAAPAGLSATMQDFY